MISEKKTYIQRNEEYGSIHTQKHLNMNKEKEEKNVKGTKIGKMYINKNTKQQKTHNFVKPQREWEKQK